MLKRCSQEICDEIRVVLLGGELFKFQVRDVEANGPIKTAFIDGQYGERAGQPIAFYSRLRLVDGCEDTGRRPAISEKNPNVVVRSHRQD
jgi:hypothetical protein